MKSHFPLPATLAILAAWLVPPAGLAADFQLVSATNGFVRSFDGRIKSNRFPPISMVWPVAGTLPPGQRFIRCTATLSDGSTPEGFRKGRKGVKVTLGGELLDATTGNTLQVLDPRTAKSDRDGKAIIDFPLAAVDNFYVAIQGRLQKKKLTSGGVSCSVRPAAAATTSQVTWRAASSAADETERLFWSQTVKQAGGGPTRARNWEGITVGLASETGEHRGVLECLVFLSTGDGGNERGVCSSRVTARADILARPDGQLIEATSVSGRTGKGDECGFVSLLIPNQVEPATRQGYYQEIALGLEGKKAVETFSVRCMDRDR